MWRVDQKEIRNTDKKIYERELRLDRVRESGDIEQDTELFIGVHNRVLDKLFDIVLFKNRYGNSNIKISLTYNSPTMKIDNNLKFNKNVKSIRGQQF